MQITRQQVVNIIGISNELKLQRQSEQATKTLHDAINALELQKQHELIALMEYGSQLKQGEKPYVIDDLVNSYIQSPIHKPAEYLSTMSKLSEYLDIAIKNLEQNVFSEK